MIRRRTAPDSGASGIKQYDSMDFWEFAIRCNFLPAEMAEEIFIQSETIRNDTAKQPFTGL